MIANRKKLDLENKSNNYFINKDNIMSIKNQTNKRLNKMKMRKNMRKSLLKIKKQKVINKVNNRV